MVPLLNVPAPSTVPLTGAGSMVRVWVTALKLAPMVLLPSMRTLNGLFVPPASPVHPLKK